MTTCTLIWAAGIGDLIPFIIALIVAALSILFQYLRGEAAKPQQGPRPANPAPPPVRPRPQQQQPQQIDEEIGEFLRRAAQRRGGPPAGQPVVVAPREEPVAAVVVAERPVGGEVSRRHLDTREFEKRSRQLGAEVALADDKVEAHLRGAFTHQISSVGSPQMSTADRAALAGPPQMQGDDVGALGETGLVSLLTNADSIREAIILNEILRRPEERW